MNQQKIHREKTIKAFAFSFVGVILPFIISLLAIIIAKKYEYIYKFLDNGEFLLFGVGLYTSALLLFDENKASIVKAYDKILSSTCIWFLIICSAFYAVIYAFGILNSSITLNILFIRIASIIFFIISVICLYRSIFIDFLKIYRVVDIKEESKKGVDNIMDKL